MGNIATLICNLFFFFGGGGGEGGGGGGKAANTIVFSDSSPEMHSHFTQMLSNQGSDLLIMPNTNIKAHAWSHFWLKK